MTVNEITQLVDKIHKYNPDWEVCISFEPNRDLKDFAVWIEDITKNNATCKYAVQNWKADDVFHLLKNSMEC